MGEVQMDKNEKVITNHLADYCAYYSISNEALNDTDILNSVLSHQKTMDELIDGYSEMGQLNSEISNDFKGSEDEALLRLQIM
ncbi:hypothetical protein FC66_GL001297 [Dellaglioa algida DSM 15638]|uniref:Uncharacterized protein n=2 Tax=Dellaglioa algida TaxID=105612 RepID=A0A0R1HGM4_9LACO|nr:hypothetical protein FC66_GL001297 [Dellaglioa algida DSM 15638]